MIQKGKIAPNFELVDENSNPFRLLESLARAPDRKLLLAFFPSAMAEAAGNSKAKAASATATGSAAIPLSEEDVATGGGGAETTGGLVPKRTGVLAVLAAHYEAIK